MDSITEKENKKLRYINIDEYIEQYDGEIKERMIKLRELIISCNFEIQEKISWGMPTFVLNGNLVHFSASKKHIGFHPGQSAINKFMDQFEGYKYSKGTIQFSNNKPIPFSLVKEIVMFRIEEQLNK